MDWRPIVYRWGFLRRTCNVLFRPEWAFGVCLFTLLAARVYLVQPAALGPVSLAVLQHDAAIVGAVLIAYACAAMLLGLRNVSARMLARFCIAICVVLILGYAADVFAYWFFVTRLYAADIITLSGEMSSVLTLVRAALSIAANTSLVKFAGLLFLGVVLLVALFRAMAGNLSATGRPIPLLGLGGVCVIFYGLPLPSLQGFYGDKPLYENFVERNLDFFRRENFSDTYRRALVAGPVAEKQCEAGRGLRIDIVVLVIESLSAYHSKYFSGVRDWTPNLDRMAVEGTALKNFHANGWTTIGGLIALLSGDFPIVPERASFNAWGSPRFEDFGIPSRPVPRLLGELGYRTSYVGSGNIDFLGQAEWLSLVGFQRVVGSGHSAFATERVRGPFNSVPDRALVQYALDELAKHAGREPQFMLLQTYWSHRPFMSPDGHKVDSEEVVIREADAQIGRLYDELTRRGFFRNGLLFVTGDHRAMERFNPEEVERFGESKASRIPGVVITKAVRLQKVVEADFQQHDLGPSIESLVSDSYCRVPLVEGTFAVNPPRPPACILHASGISRNLIYAKCDAGEGTMRIAGDNTRLERGSIREAPELIRYINLSRVR